MCQTKAQVGWLNLHPVRTMLDAVHSLTLSPQPQTPVVKAALATGSNVTFRQILSELNPLQYLPVVGTIYRSVTGDTVPEAARAIGSFLVSGLIGGPIGLAVNAAIQAFDKVTGFDPEKIGHNLLASIGIGNTDTAAVAAAPVPSIKATSSQDAVAWSPAQLKAYGVTTSTHGVMQRGVIEGADVLNDLELARHQKTFAAPVFA